MDKSTKLEETYKRKEMTRKEYDEAYEKNNLVERLKGKENILKEFTDKYLNEFL